MPQADRVVVPDAKVRDYLLQPAHPQNLGKAGFFHRFAFRLETWRDLATALRTHPLENPLIDIAASPAGDKYVVRCSLRSPDGRNPCIQSVWVVEDAAPPRLVTAYPATPGAAP